MFKLKLLLVLVLILVLTLAGMPYILVSPVVMATPGAYYISTDGDDNSPGTLEAPWKTLSGNADKVKAGDTVYIRGGIYEGQTLAVDNSGTEGNYITYMAYPGEKPVISGSSAYGVKLRKVEYVIIDGLEIRETKGAWIEINRSSNIVVRNCKLTEGKLRTNGFFIFKSSYVTVEDCSIDTLFNQSIQDMDLMRVEESHHCIFQRLDMTKGPHSCINFWNTSYSIIRDCKLNNVWQKNVDIISNQPGVAGRNIVENNLIFGSRHAIAAGFEWKGGLGIQIAQSDNIIRNNLIYDNDFYGIILNSWSGDEVSPTGAARNRIYNNVIAKSGMVKNQTNSQSGMVISDWGSGKDIGDNVLINNIFYENKEKVLFVKPSLGSNLFENNSFFSADAAEIIFSTENKGKNSVSWFEENNGDNVRGNLTSDPQFKDASGNDYSILKTSPCIDAGRDLTKAVSDGPGETLVVEDAAFFHDGYGITDGDNIVVGNNTPVKIVKIDYSSNTITLASNIEWKKGDPVNLPYKGKAPDIGAYESEFAAEGSKQQTGNDTSDMQNMPDVKGDEVKDEKSDKGNILLMAAGFAVIIICTALGFILKKQKRKRV